MCEEGCYVIVPVPRHRTQVNTVTEIRCSVAVAHTSNFMYTYRNGRRSAGQVRAASLSFLCSKLFDK